MAWRNINEIGVPVGDVVTIKTAGGKEFKASWEWGLVSDDGSETGGWHEHEEGAAPPCWTDGICWGKNHNEVPSDPVIAWKK